MPRNISGVYTLPAGNPVSPATLIESAWANATLADIASSITDSLDRSGRGSMLAAFKAMDGILAQPGISFGTEPASGLYRAGAADIRFAVAGTDSMKWTPIGVSIPGTLTVTGALAANGGLSFTGAITAIVGMAPAFLARSGDAAQWTALSLGRTATEGYIGISGGASHIATGDVAGDVVIRNNNARILFAVGGATPIAYLNTAGLGVNVSPTSPIHALLTANSAYSAADMVASGVVSTFRNATTTNGTAAVVRMDVNGSASSAVAAFATVHTGDGASAIAFGTRPNAAGNIIERARIDNVGNFGLGVTPTAYGSVGPSLQVKGSSASSGGHITAIDSSGTGWVSLYSGITEADNPAITWQNTGALRFATTNNPAVGTFIERMRIDESGRVGIARAAATHIFEVAGTTALGHTIADMLRLTHDSAFLSFYNTVASTRSGYIQSSSAGVAVWSNEVGGAGATSSIAVNGANRLTVTGGGIVNILAGSGSLQLNGAATRGETNPAFAINSAFSFTIPRRPDAVRVALECLTAEAGYVAGQTVEIPPSRVGYTGGYWTFTNAASTSLTVQTFNATLQIPSTAGVATNVTPANWSLRVTAVFL